MVQEAIEIDPAIWQAYRGIRELTPDMGISDNIEDEVMQSSVDGRAWDRKYAEL
jgi:hypothetical protein